MSQNEHYDVTILIGRFQPFHNGHAALLAAALEMGDEVLVVLGSAGQARSARNPFTWEERAAMIAASLVEADAARVAFVPMRDFYDDSLWAAAVERALRARCGDKRIALVGFHKDASSDYLKCFPDWAFVAMTRQGEVDATAVRQVYFGDDEADILRARLAGLLPEAVVAMLMDWARLPVHAAMRAEHRAIVQYREKWGAGPFVTVDAVVTLAGHVLLVRRGRGPGKGSWAVPGGFLEGRERLSQGALRELREETGLDIQHGGDIVRAVAVFDHPDRSARGRIITHAHWFDMGSNPAASNPEHLPEVRGADDAAEARWFRIADLPAMEETLFEDHFHILDHFLGLKKMSWEVIPGARIREAQNESTSR
ncbi:MAG: NUDIX domain-containing protein [Azoarcus sp.]|jgi:bifunctional NMN adenylyltransferase/nudix hydrolase|nr:NUDIX domain-containing protein [Azoarcus sp.]